GSNVFETESKSPSQSSGTTPSRPACRMPESAAITRAPAISASSSVVRVTAPPSRMAKRLIQAASKGQGRCCQPRPESALPTARSKGSQPQRIQADKAFCVLLVVRSPVILKGDQRIRIEGLVGTATGDDDVALVELQAHLAFHVFLALVDQRLEHLTLWREPEAVVDQLCIARHQLILEMRRTTVKRKRFHRTMRCKQDRAARRFVDAARLHADEAVFDQVKPADAVVATQIVQRCQQGCRRKFLAVDRYSVATKETDGDLRWLVGRVHWRNRALMHVFRRLVPRIFENLALGRRVQQVGVHRERCFALLVLRTRDLVLASKVQKVSTRLECPVTPRRNHLDVGIERIGGKLKTDLVITLAGCAMSHSVSAGLFGDLNEALGDQWTGDGRSQKVGALVKRVGAEHGEHEIADKFLAQIIDIDLADAKHLGLLACRLEFFTLAKIR